VENSTVSQARASSPAPAGSPAPVSSREPAGDRATAASVPVTATAWCAACREHTEFVIPVGLLDASADEFACVYCGWAVLVAADIRLPDQPASAA